MPETPPVADSPGRPPSFLRLVLWSAVALLLLNAYLLLSFGSPTSLVGLRTKKGSHRSKGGKGEHRLLGVVVPTHAGDTVETIQSLEKWPSKCTEDTLAHVDLVIYKAEEYDRRIENELLPRFRATAGRCFADTRIVFGGLSKEENVYPTGASEQFYKMYLDKNVSKALARYDVLGIIEHDVVVAHEDSFSQLYQSAFGSSHPYWVKGSVLAGKNFHETATISGYWNILGHINGNALYNNTDPSFTEFVQYTQTRWRYTLEEPGKPPVTKYRFPYDVALWATIADFPYSWPLWQRYAERFMNSHLIANIGFVDVDGRTITDAVTRDTLFIHGSSKAGGSKKFAAAIAAASLAEAHAGLDKKLRKNSGDNTDEDGLPVCTETCSSRSQALSGPGTSQVCDSSCLAGGEQGVRFDGYLCGAGDPSLYGESCRTCYTDEDLAREAERILRLGLSMDSVDDDAFAHNMRHQPRQQMLQQRPQESGGSGDEGSGVGGGSGSGSMYDQEEDGRHVIMCDTMRPPTSRECSQKCSVKPDTVCDHTCGTGRFNNYNCNWRFYGETCRYCFNDVRLALKADIIARQFGGRVIMCDTHNPPQRLRLPPSEVEESIEGLDVIEGVGGVGGLGIGGGVDVVDGGALAVGEGDEAVETPTFTDGINSTWLRQQAKLENNAAVTPFVKIVRSDICAFIPGYFKFISETRVSVESVATFMPGMRVVVAVHPSDSHVYRKAMGELPRVSIVEVSDVGASALLADKFCNANDIRGIDDGGGRDRDGEGEEEDRVKLIYYMAAGELLSREINFKDTHSPRGDLLVVYNEKVQSTADILGFSSPTFGPDIMLPPSVNIELRHVVMKAHGSKRRKVAGEADDQDEYLMHILSRFPNVPVPQLLAALAYARNPPGIWFFDPSKWVDQHIFKVASIWNIPLIKPRFSCMVDMSLAVRGYDMGLALQQTLNHFKAGTTCETGFMDLDPQTQLQPNPNVEFSEITGKEMPDMAGLKVSVMYSLTEEDGSSATKLSTLEASIASVAEHFPGALEVVLVVAEQHRHLFAETVDTFSHNGPHEVRMAVPGGSAGGLIEAAGREASARAAAATRGGAAAAAAAGKAAGAVASDRERTRRRLTADEFCEGDFVVYLDPNVVLFKAVTYDTVFHFGRPVVPYGRYPDSEGSRVEECRERETAHLFGEPLLHRISVFSSNNNVFPVGMLARLREFVVRKHQQQDRLASSPVPVVLEEILANFDESWALPAAATGTGSGEDAGRPSCPRVLRQRLLPDFEYMGAFLWHEMHEEVHWLPTDPRDLEPDGWTVDDYFRFSWTCRALHPPSPDGDGDVDGDIMQQFMAELENVNSALSCWRFNNRWTSP